MGQQMVRVLVIFFCVIVSPVAALAQSGIAGVVRDTSGAVLPGVTVEASSPALIEKVRTVVTDDQGQYKIVDLRPGVYTVTFTLPGFGLVKRDGLELTANFTANVNGEMRVGGLEETVTVSGVSPVVDIQNVVQRKVITAQVLEALPSARNLQTLGAALLPGLVASGAKNAGNLSGEHETLLIHGSRLGDCAYYLDGLSYSIMNNTGCTTVYVVDPGETQEFSYEIGASSTQWATGGVHVNLVPKDGGNLFTGSIFANYSNSNLQNSNLTADLRARGLQAVSTLKNQWDVNPSAGGPIKRDKLWFFGSFRRWGYEEFVADRYYALDPLAFVYTPDLSRQGINDEWITGESLRLTWQATPKNKLTVYGGHQYRDQPHVFINAPASGLRGVVTPEATNYQHNLSWLTQATWSSPVTNRVLLQAGASYLKSNFNATAAPGVTEDILSVRELSTNMNLRAAPTTWWMRSNNYGYRAALSYVTGSHAFKTGLTLATGSRHNVDSVNGDVILELLKGVPRSVTVNATPLDTHQNLNAALGLYAQDQWTIKRMTLNVGMRFDYHNSSVPEQHHPPARFVPARNFAEVPDVPNWKDLSPRLGVAYDLFGTGKTAVKVTLSRYLAGEIVDLARAVDPLVTSVNSATRSWTDVNGDFVPQEEELGVLSNPSFGQVDIRTRYADNVRKGFGRRGFNWETSAGVQHELLPRVAVNATYFRRSYGNFTVTDNLLNTPVDYDPFCITAPVDARLPGGGGNQICGLFDVNPAKRATNNLVTFADSFGKQTEVYNGVDLTVDARLQQGAVLQGGLNVGRLATNNCFVVDSPQLRFCDVKWPFQPNVKLLGTVRLPWDLETGVTFQSVPGPEIKASYVATNEEIRGSLNRNLAAGPTVLVDLIAPGTMFGDRKNQVDLRVAKVVEVGRSRVKGIVDVYNLFNASQVLNLNTRYGSAWQRPTAILLGRVIKFGAQVDF